MPLRTRPFLIALLLALAAGSFYAVGLDRSPVYLVHDEVIYALNAHAIATTLRDLNGQFLPVSIYVVGSFFATPLNIYATALALKVMPLSEVTVRMPSVIVGLVNIVLVYFIGRRVFKREGYAVIAAVLLALTPAHFIHSRLATDHLYTVTFALGWLLCMLGVEHEHQTRRIALANALLGVGVYTYLGALVTMPVCVAITFVVLFQQGMRSFKPYLAAVVGFALPLLPFIWWHLSHPAQYARQIQMYSLYDAARLNPLQGARELTSYVSLTERSSVYWDYFGPSFLFFAGDTGLINGTRYAGVFLWSIMALLPIGFYRLVVARTTPSNLLLVLGLLTSPLAAALVAERYKINRALVMLPFAVLVATVGVEALWSARHRVWRAVAVALLVAMPLQFAAFYTDYFGDYRVRSYTWFEYNVRGGLEAIIEGQTSSPAPVYLATNIQWVEYYWPLYLVKHGRSDLRSRTVYFNPQSQPEVAAIAPGSFVLCRAADEPALVAASGLRRARAITEPDGAHTFSVLRK